MPMPFLGNMNTRKGNRLLTTLLNAGSACLTRQADGRSCPLVVSWNTRRALMESDITEQAAWLANQAVNRGYGNLDELLARAPGLFTQLAALWRRGRLLPMAA